MIGPMMNTTQTTIARGTWQMGLWRALLAGQEICNPVRSLRGRAKSYAGRYDNSFHAMLQRARDAGFVIERTAGPHGGQWSATYRLVREEA